VARRRPPRCRRRSRACAWRAACLLETTTDTWGQALAISQLGARARRLKFEEAEPILLRAADLARRTGERYMIGSCLPKLGNLYLEQGDHAAAEPLYREALSAFRAIHELWWTGRCMRFLALVAYRQGNLHRAVRLLGGSDAVLKSGGSRLIPREERDHVDLIQGLSAGLGEAAFRAALADCQTMTPEQAIAYALDERPPA